MRKLIFVTLLSLLPLNSVLAGGSHTNEQDGHNYDITEQYVLQTVRLQNNFGKVDKRITLDYISTLKNEICKVEEIGSIHEGGILFKNKKDPNAPLMVHFHGGGNDVNFTKNKFGVLIYELLKNGFSVYCPHYNSDDTDDYLNETINYALQQYYQKYPLDPKNSGNPKKFFIDAFSSGVQVADRFLKTRHKNHKNGDVDEFAVLGAHYRVGEYEKVFGAGVNEYLDFPLFISIAGQDQTVGLPFFGFRLVQTLLDKKRTVNFYFMPTGSHHLIPVGLLGDDKEFPEEDDAGASLYARAKKYASSKRDTDQFKELYDYVAFKTRILKYFLSLGAGAGVSEASLFASEQVKDRLSEAYAKFYKVPSTSKKEITWDAGATINNTVTSGATAAPVRGTSPSNIYKEFYAKDDLLKKRVSGLSSELQELINRALTTEEEYMQEAHGDTFPAYHGASRKVTALYTIMSLFEYIHRDQTCSFEVNCLRCPHYSGESRSLINELLPSFVACANSPAQKAVAQMFNYNDRFNDWFVAASPWLFGTHAREGSFPLEFVDKDISGKSINLREKLFVFFTSHNIKTTREMLDRYVALARNCPPAIFQIFMSKEYLDTHAYLCEMWGEPIEYLLGQASGFLERFSNNSQAAEQELQKHKEYFHNPNGEQDFNSHGLIPELQMRIMIDPKEFGKEVVVKTHPRNIEDYKEFIKHLSRLLGEDFDKESQPQLFQNSFDQVLCNILTGRTDLLHQTKFNDKDFIYFFENPISETSGQKTTLFEFALEYATDDALIFLLNACPDPINLIKTHIEKVKDRIKTKDDARLLEYVTDKNLFGELLLGKAFIGDYIMDGCYNCAQFILDRPDLYQLYFSQGLTNQVNYSAAQEITKFPDTLTYSILSSSFPNDVKPHVNSIMHQHTLLTTLTENKLAKMRAVNLLIGRNTNRLKNCLTQYYIELLHNTKIFLDNLPDKNLRRWCAASFYIDNILGIRSSSIVSHDKIIRAQFEAFKEHYKLNIKNTNIF